MTSPDSRRRLRAEVRAAADVLRSDWDPIGRGEMENLPADEYDSYAPHVVSLIENGADDAAIAAYLKELEDDVITVSSGRDLRAIAGRLRRAVTTASSCAS